MPRTYNGPRTPRKDKSWSTEASGTGGFVVAENATQVVVDLTASYQAQLGLLQLQRPTVIRSIGTVWMGFSSDSSNPRGRAQHTFGAAWIPEASGTFLPDPEGVGVRQVPWLYRHTLFADNDDVTDDHYGNNTGAFVRFDSTAQRQQQVVGDSLKLMLTASADSGTETRFHYVIHTMLTVS